MAAVTLDLAGSSRQPNTQALKVMVTVLALGEGQVGDKRGGFHDPCSVEG